MLGLGPNGVTVNHTAPCDAYLLRLTHIQRPPFFFLGGTRILFDGLREMRDHRLFDGLLSRAGDSRVGTLPSHMGWNLSRVAQRHSPIVIRGVHNLLLLHLKRDLGLSLVDPDLHLAGPLSVELLDLELAFQLGHPLLV